MQFTCYRPQIKILEGQVQRKENLLWLNRVQNHYVQDKKIQSLIPSLHSIYTIFKYSNWMIQGVLVTHGFLTSGFATSGFLDPFFDIFHKLSGKKRIFKIGQNLTKLEAKMHFH